MTRRTKLSCGYYDDPLTLMYHVNNGLYSLRTEKTRAQMSYSSVTQKMTLHMTENTRFTIPYHSSTTSMLGFHKKVVTGTETTATSASSLVPDSRPSDSSYPHRSPRRGGHDAGIQHPIRIHGHRGVSYSG